MLGGQWTLPVATGDLPPLLTLKNMSRTLTLKHGETRQVALRVLPGRRTLRLLERGMIR